MCSNTSELKNVHLFCSTSKTTKVHVHRLTKRAKRKAKAGKLIAKMEITNLNLHMKNQSIIEENERLRQKAVLLHQENIALLSQLRKIHSQEKKEEPWHEFLNSSTRSRSKMA